MILRIAQDHLGEGFAQHSVDPINDRADIRHDLISSESYHAKIVPIEPCSASHIMSFLPSLTMLAAIYFDHQSRGQADKIREIWSQGKLAAKTETVDLLSSQEIPELVFRI